MQTAIYILACAVLAAGGVVTFAIGNLTEAVKRYESAFWNPDGTPRR